MKSRLGVKMEQALEEAEFYRLTENDIRRTHSLFLVANDSLWIGKLFGLRSANPYLYNILCEKLTVASIIYQGSQGRIHVAGVNDQVRKSVWCLLALLMLPLYFACDAKWPKISSEIVKLESAALLERYSGNPTGLQSDFMRELLKAQGEWQQANLKELIRESELHPAKIALFEEMAYLFLKVFPCRFSI